MRKNLFPLAQFREENTFLGKILNLSSVCQKQSACKRIILNKKIYIYVTFKLVVIFVDMPT